MNWAELDPKRQRKALILGAIVGVALLVLFWPARVSPKRLPGRPQVRQIRPLVRQVPKAAPRKPVPAAQTAVSPPLPKAVTGVALHAPAPPAATATAATPPAVIVPPALHAPFAELLGIYQGQETLGSRGACQMRLELRRNPDRQEGFFAFTRLVCTPPFQERATESKASAARAIDARQKAMNPTASILTGLAVGGSIQLRADSNIGVRDARDGCEITSLNVMPFGTRAIAVDWQEKQEGLCRGGQMVMNKTR